MTEKPIIFSAPMVRAILAGKKTQTRRIVKPQPHEAANCLRESADGRWYAAIREIIDESTTRYMPLGSDQQHDWRCPFGVPGDRLWVRETWMRHPDEPDTIFYRATDRLPWDQTTDPERWRSPIHMPRSLSRITLEVTEDRVQRVQDISEEDAVAEGFKAELHGTWWQGYRDCGELGLIHQDVPGDEPPEWMIEPKKDIPRPWLDRSAKQNFRDAWNQIHGRPGEWAWDRNDWVWAITFRRVEP